MQSNRLFQQFSHHAMATTFEISIVNQDMHYAEQAAHEAFCLLDKLEQDFSRFIENSDISRINSLQSDESTRVGLDTFECLLLCAELYAATGGCFDVTVGHLLNIWHTEDNQLRQPKQHQIQFAMNQTGLPLLELNEATHEVTVLHAPVLLDLGGIGKGYAIDRMAELLLEWEITDFFIHGGHSSLRANGKQPGQRGWRVSLHVPHPMDTKPKVYTLYDQAMSSSGVEKGKHIINPLNAKPIERNAAVWVIAQSAAIADGLSTAFMIMTNDQIRQFCSDNPNFQALSIEAGNPPVVNTFGQWDASS